MDNRRTIPVYVIHWRAIEWCESTVRSIQASEGVELRITVVDNECSGGAPLRQRLPPTVRTLPSAKNIGFAGAANLALRDCVASTPHAPFAIIASHDVRLEPTTISRLVEDMESDPTFGIIGPAIDFMGSYSNPSVGPGFTPIPLEPGVYDCDWITGTCLMLRIECVDQVGEFDSSFGSYTEDVDYCLRARDRGWRIAVDSAAIASSLGSADGTTAVEQVALNNLRLAKKRGGLRALFFGWIRLARHVARTGAGAIAPVANPGDAHPF